MEAESVPPEVGAPAPSDVPTAEQRALADAMEALMLEVERDEANWDLDDRLEYQTRAG